MDIITGSKDQTVKTWRIFTESNKFTSLKTYIGHDASVSFVDFIQEDSEESSVDVISSGFDNTILLWIIQNQVPVEEAPAKAKKGKRKNQEKEDNVVSKPDFKFTGHKQKVSAAKWCSREQLISGSNDNTVKLWDAASGIAVNTLHGNRAVTCLDHSKSKNLTVTGHNDNRLRLWDVRSNEGELIKQTFKSHKGWVTSVEFHPKEENLFISSSLDKSVKVWDVRSSIPLHTLPEFKDKVLTSTWKKKYDEEEESATDHILSGGADTKLTITNIVTKR